MEIRRPIVQEWCIPEQYTSSPEIIKKCLQEALSEGTMGTQVNAPIENEDMKKKERETIIKKHMEQFTTKYYESDKRWHSFLPDDTSPRKMKPIAKRKWQDLEEAIVEFYKAQDHTEKRKRLTLRTLFPEWFAYKWNDTKTEAGCRTIYVVSSALELFAKVKEHNVAHGYSCEAEDYIFLYRGNRITSKSISNKYKKYCKKLGIVRKSNHKARKTCLTKIADNPNINLKDAMQYSGHKDVKTYIKHYCFSRYSDEHQRKELEKCLSM